MSFHWWLYRHGARRVLAALFVAIIVGGAATILNRYWPAEPSVPQRIQIEPQDAFVARLEPECVALLKETAERLAANPKEADECRDKTSAQKKNHADLAQSIRAANAAEEAVWLTYLQTCVGFSGALLVLLTLVATFWAADAASRAAVAAEKTASIAQKTAKQELRAYVNVDAGNSFNQGGKQRLFFEFRPIIENTGQTPAYDLEVISDVRLLPYPIPSGYDFSLPPSTPKSVTTLGPGKSKFTNSIMKRKLTLSELRLVARSPTNRLCLYGTVRYRDSFNEWHYTNFCFTFLFGMRRHPQWNTTQQHNDSN